MPKLKVQGKGTMMNVALNQNLKAGIDASVLKEVSIDTEVTIKALSVESQSIYSGR